jgi:hypothetical protein
MEEKELETPAARYYPGFLFMYPLEDLISMKRSLERNKFLNFCVDF